MSTVLLVDDDLENRWALQLALESAGHHVVLAENGYDALRKAARHIPELVITDLQMPEIVERIEDVNFTQLKLSTGRDLDP
ncbi:response regulator [Paraburkholderia madseniana]|uniref:response regulator n=1 Tax=Paraburkholderia madseniana TaxID=2599607 RepID=UPI001F241845|nr:response regulator [Paraburkholderia madseniana]